MNSSMTLPMAQTDERDAFQIPALTHSEAGVLAQAELNRFLDVVNTLTGDDWRQPTDCTAWSVRDILAHQAGSYAGYARWGEFARQMSARPRNDEQPVDATNRTQLADRQGKQPAELIAELREVGPRAIRTRQRLPWLLRQVPLPLGPPAGWRNVGYLTDLIYPRDTWMHRVDICRAAGRPFVQTAAHDGRIVALVLRDLALKLRKVADAPTVSLDLSGEAGGRYKIGPAPHAAAAIACDVLEFNRLASDRIRPDDARHHPQFRVEGDDTAANWLLARLSILY